MSFKQIKDILKGSLRFNQSQLEAEENEQITIEDDHYCSNNQSKLATIETPEVLISKQPCPPKQQVTCLHVREDPQGLGYFCNSVLNSSKESIKERLTTLSHYIQCDLLPS